MIHSCSDELQKWMGEKYKSASNSFDVHMHTKNNIQSHTTVFNSFNQIKNLTEIDYLANIDNLNKIEHISEFKYLTKIQCISKFKNRNHIKYLT